MRKVCFTYIHLLSFHILYCESEISITSLCIGGLGVGGDKEALGPFCLTPPSVHNAAYMGDDSYAVDPAVVYT